MKKYFAAWDFVFVLLICLFGGVLDGYCFLFRGDTFCMVQTGNLVKSIVMFVLGIWDEATYALLMFITFCVFIFVFYLLLKYLKQKNINYHFITMPLIACFLIPSIVWEFDKDNYLNYSNVISGIFFAMIGSIIAVSFKNVKFKTDKKISFNAAMMTGNMRSMMESYADYIRTKDKEKLFQTTCYLIMIFSFAIGVAVTILCYKFVPIYDWKNYSSFLIIYSLIIILIIILHHRYQWIKSIDSIETNKIIN